MLLSSSLRELEDKIDDYSFPDEPDFAAIEKEFTDLYEEFNTKAPMLSLLVSDNAILDIEHSFNDIIGYAKAESADGVITSVGRLRIDLGQLRELAGLTVKSVF